MLGGWILLLRFDKFIKCQKKEISLSRVTSADYPYVRALQESKWQSRNLCDAEVSYKEGKIEISVKIQLYDNELLERCLVGFCSERRQREDQLWLIFEGGHLQIGQGFWSQYI